MLMAALALAGIWAYQHRPTLYDPTRDAYADIKNALAEAKSSRRKVLLEVGGDWCPWCLELERVVQSDTGLLALRDRNFVTVKVYWGPKNTNPGALTRYPRPNGFPHFFVLDENEKVLQSKNTEELEAGQSYDREKIRAFLNTWTPAK